METLSRLQALNPFKPNGISHSYQLDQSIKASKYDQEIPQSHIAGQPMAFWGWATEQWLSQDNGKTVK